MPESMINSKPLSGGELAQAYALIQAIDPSLTLDQWRDYVAALGDDQTADRPGILTAQTDEGRILGLAAFRILHELRCAPNLGVENLIAPRMPGDRLTVRVLLQALEEIARSRNLDCLSVRLPIAYMRSSTPPPLREVLEEEGFQSVAVQMHKTLNKNGKSRNGGSFFG